MVVKTFGSLLTRLAKDIAIRVRMRINEDFMAENNFTNVWQYGIIRSVSSTKSRPDPASKCVLISKNP